MRSIEKLEKMDEIRQPNATELEEPEDLRRGITKIYKREKIMWQQGAICKWLKEGDVSTTMLLG